ncbi:MAG: MFS transporter [Solirubrobacteraceae bacterium]|nr:MFS transporter [Solirubrobacteraceae bacterium]
MLPLLTTPGQLRRFLLVSAQSGVGTSMGYVALLLVAYDQAGTAWALAVVLTANLLPAALLAPYFGKLADRHSRRTLCVTADVLCAVAFTGIALSGNFAVTTGLTLIAGTGAALFRPASRAAVPTLAGPKTDDAVGALVTLNSVARLLGPVIGAGLLLAGPVQSLLLINALTFAVSALILLRLTLDGPKAPARPWIPMTLDEALADELSRRRSIRDGLAAAHLVPRLPLVIYSSAGATFTLGLANVGEPLLATGPLGGGDAAFSLVVAVFGVGATVGALLGAASVRRLVISIIAGSAVMAAIAVSPTLAIALVFFALGGIVEGVSISCDERLVTALTPEHVLGRVFGLKDSLDAIALLGAFFAGAGVASTFGARWVFGASAVVTGLVGIAALLLAVRDSRPQPPVAQRPTVAV